MDQGTKRDQKGNKMVFINDPLFFEFINHVVAPKVGQVGKSLQKRRRRRQRGGFIPGKGMLGFMTRSGRSKARRTGLRALKRDADFLGKLMLAYVPKLRKVSKER